MVRRQLAGLGAHVSRLAPSRPALVCVLLFALSFFAAGGSGDGVRYLVGAHYYVWYPDNFANGYLRGALRPAQAPALGEYDSRSASIAERHIALAASHAIDFFTLDWWPSRPAQNAAIESGFLRAANIDEIRFCIFYESKDLGRSADENDIVFAAATKDRFVSDLMTIARRYFGHPSYLRIDGRPTLVLYVTRQMRGLFPQAMREMRRAMAAEGYDPFVIGDEIFWAVVEAAEDPDAAARVTGEPQLSRIRLFDAITAYNLYAGWERHRGYGSASRFVADSVNPHHPGGDSGLQRSSGPAWIGSLRHSPPLDRRGFRRIVLHGGNRTDRQAAGGPAAARDSDHVVERVERGYRDRAALSRSPHGRRRERATSPYTGLCVRGIRQRVRRHRARSPSALSDALSSGKQRKAPRVVVCDGI
jgi:hypothetical protein